MRQSPGRHLGPPTHQKHLINRHNKNVTGQKKLTCSCTIIGLVGDHIVIQFKKYTQARKVLFKLGGVEEFSVRFKVLLQEHLMLDSDKQQDRVTLWI